MQDHVDQVLQGARPGDRAVLGHVADQDSGQRSLLGQADQGRGDLAHLGHAAWHAIDPGRREGLYRVHDQQARPDRLDVREQRGQVGLSREEEVLSDGTDPVGALPHLSRGLLAGDVQDDGALGGESSGLEQQRGLADAGLAGQQRDRPWH